MGFQQGLSGLNAASRNLDVIGHNIANANTTGMKSGRAEFAEVMAASIGASRSGNIGIGVDVGAGAWVLEGLQADVHFRIDQELLEILKIGLRPGLGIAQYEPVSRLLVPVAAYVRLKVLCLYFEALGGVSQT